MHSLHPPILENGCIFVATIAPGGIATSQCKCLREMQQADVRKPMLIDAAFRSVIERYI